MAHQLTERADGLVEFAYHADHGQGWHGLGQAVQAEHARSIPAWANAAGMDWLIKRSRVRFGEGENQQVMDSHHVLFRSDSKAPLGIVSPTYKIVQPREMLEFFRDIVKVGGLELSAAGTLFGGQRFWATARIGEAAPVSVADKVGGYILITSSADGSLATEVRRTTTRVVCNNTLQMAIREGKASVKVSHRSVFDPEAVREFMGLNSAAWDSFRHTIVRLANKPIVAEQAEDITAKLFATAPAPAAVEAAREMAGYTKVLALFNGEGKGSQLDGVHGTAWGLLNAVTEYADHHVRARSDENRFVSAQWGPGAALKAKALDALLTA